MLQTWKFDLRKQVFSLSLVKKFKILIHHVFTSDFLMTAGSVCAACCSYVTMVQCTELLPLLSKSYRLFARD